MRCGASGGGGGGRRTREDVVAREEVGADGQEDHGDGEGGELVHDAPARCGEESASEPRADEERESGTHERSAWPSGVRSAALRCSGVRGRGCAGIIGMAGSGVAVCGDEEAREDEPRTLARRRRSSSPWSRALQAVRDSTELSNFPVAPPRGRRGRRVLARRGWPSSPSRPPLRLRVALPALSPHTALAHHGHACAPHLGRPPARHPLVPHRCGPPFPPPPTPRDRSRPRLIARVLTLAPCTQPGHSPPLRVLPPSVRPAFAPPLVALARPDELTLLSPPPRSLSVPAIAQIDPPASQAHRTDHRSRALADVEGTVNDPTPFPAPNKAHGQYHWTFERLLSVSLVPLIGATAVSSVNPVLDGVLCTALVAHSHMVRRSSLVLAAPRAPRSATSARGFQTLTSSRATADAAHPPRRALTTS